MKPSSDREAITLIMNGLAERDVFPFAVNDGEEMIATGDTAEVLDAVMAVDEAVVWVTLPNGAETFIFFVLGNDPEEVVCDHGVSLSEYIDPIVDSWL